MGVIVIVLGVMLVVAALAVLLMMDMENGAGFGDDAKRPWFRPRVMQTLEDHERLHPESRGPRSAFYLICVAFFLLPLLAMILAHLAGQL